MIIFDVIILLYSGFVCYDFPVIRPERTYSPLYLTFTVRKGKSQTISPMYLFIWPNYLVVKDGKDRVLCDLSGLPAFDVSPVSG